MNKFLLLIVLLISSCTNLITRSPSGIEGDRIGNGGGAWVCSKNGEITSITSFDLFEAQNLWNKNIIPNEKTFEEYIQIAKAKLKETNFAKRQFFEMQLLDVDKEFETFQNKLKPINFHASNLRLKVSEDVSPIVEQEDCDYHQIITYFDEETWFYNKKLFDSLDNLSKAALITHEIVYSYLRKSDKVETSIRTRRIVGNIFSDFKYLPSEKGTQFCTNFTDYERDNAHVNEYYKISQANKENRPKQLEDEPIIKFYAVKNNNETMRLFFIKIDQRSIPWDEYIDVPDRLYDFKKYPECLKKKGIIKDYYETYPFSVPCSERVFEGKTTSSFETGEKVKFISKKGPKNFDTLEIYLPRINKSAMLRCR